MRSFFLRLSLTALGLALLVGFRSGVSLHADEQPHAHHGGHDHPHHTHGPKHHPQGPHEHGPGDHDHGPGDHPAARDAVNGELGDVARSLRSIDQSYGYRGMRGCGSYTAGSAYRDWHACGECPPPGGRRVLPPPPLVLGGCRHAGCNGGCSSSHRTRGGCGHHYGMGERSGCGCVGLNLRPHPPLPNDHYREDCDEQRSYDSHVQFDDRDVEEEGCTILDRRICTGCGHVYPRDEQLRCGCSGGPVLVSPAAPATDPTPVEFNPMRPTEKGE